MATLRSRGLTLAAVICAIVIIVLAVLPLGSPRSALRIAFDAVGIAVAVACSAGLAARQVARRTTASVEAAIVAERRRLANEIHDGLAQELAFIVSQSRRLGRRGPYSTELEQLAAAGEVALVDARRAIH